MLECFFVVFVVATVKSILIYQLSFFRSSLLECSENGVEISSHRDFFLEKFQGNVKDFLSSISIPKFPIQIRTFNILMHWILTYWQLWNNEKNPCRSHQSSMNQPTFKSLQNPSAIMLIPQNLSKLNIALFLHSPRHSDP